MKPVRFTKKNDKVVFHYTFSDLRRFIVRGKSHGDVGPLLISFNGNLIQYKGFGTIENPFKNMVKLDFNHFPLFDGPLPDPEKIVNPPMQEKSLVSYKFIMLDLS